MRLFLLITSFLPLVGSFVVVPKAFPAKSQLHLVVDPALAIEVFDGTTVDPTVVSSAFWTGLQAKIISVIIGQILATFVFGLISSLAASQFSKVSEFVSKKVFNEENVSKTVEGVSQGINTAGKGVQQRV